MRLLAIAATDSHLKWAAHLLRDAPPSWCSEIVALVGPTSPSPRQVEAAVAGTPFERPPVLSIAEIRHRVVSSAADVVVLACPGPVITVLDALALPRGPQRPVVVAGTPGIALPARRRAVLARRAVDVFITHSIAERCAYEAVVRASGTRTRVALARLPTLTKGCVRSGDRDVVFAPQAIVPRGLDDRRRLLRALAVAAKGDLVVHERTAPGERTAHREEHSYRDIWRELVAADAFAPDFVRFAHGPMAASISRARSLVTVSSTAAIEAIAARVPVGIVADFGVGDDMLNSVFMGSGCLIDVTAHGVRDVARPSLSWRHANYFHPDTAIDWTALVESAVASSDRATGASASTWWPAAKWFARSRIGDRRCRRSTSVVESCHRGSGSST